MTTTKRTAITAAQQWRWHQAVESAYDELRRLNTGVCPLSGTTFGEEMPNYIFGGDETCLLASDHAGPVDARSRTHALGAAKPAGADGEAEPTRAD